MGMYVVHLKTLGSLHALKAEDCDEKGGYEEVETLTGCTASLEQA